MVGFIFPLLFSAQVASAQPRSFPAFLGTLSTLPPRDRAAAVESYLGDRRTPIVEGDSALTFVWYGRADSVMVTGTHLDFWTRRDRMERLPCSDSAGGPALFHRSYTLPGDARIEYKLIVNGEYVLDPRNVRTTPPFDFVNSEAAMPRFAPTATTRYRPGVAHGTLDTILFRSSNDSLKERSVIVYRPAGYAKLSKLPSVYVHDGHGALRWAFFANVLDNMIADRRIPPVLGVFIPAVQREPEYVGRKGIAYQQAICDELVPLIDRTYRTARSPGKRAMMGISNGGHIALSTVLKRTDLFRNVAGQSSTITTGLYEILATRAATAPLPGNMRIYVECGRYDILSPNLDFPRLNREFSRELARYGIPHRYVEPNDGHDWASWRERMEDILRWFFGDGAAQRTTHKREGL